MDLAPALTKVLLENGQEIPEFLEEFKPTGELKFDEDDGVGQEIAYGLTGNDGW